MRKKRKNKKVNDKLDQDVLKKIQKFWKAYPNLIPLAGLLQEQGKLVSENAWKFVTLITVEDYQSAIKFLEMLNSKEMKK